MATEDQVRRVALRLPGAYERLSYDGQPSWRTKPRMFACIRSNDGALVIWVASLKEKEALLALDPLAFFTTAHYDGQPIVLVHLERLDRGLLTDLITESWYHRAPSGLSRGFYSANDASRGEFPVDNLGHSRLSSNRR